MSEQDIVAIVRQVLDLERPLAARAHVALSVFEPAGADRRACRSGEALPTVQNIVRNAIEAAPSGRVAIEAAVIDRELALVVMTAAACIPEPVRRRMFEPFFSTKDVGSGLGMSIAPMLVTMHGGPHRRRHRSGRHADHRRDPRGPVAMFRDEGPGRSHHKNQLLAGHLALVAGFVNSAGFILIGLFTSHVTGNIGRLANDLALGDLPAAVFAAIFAIAYFAGAFTASVALESDALRRRSVIHGLLLLGEAVLLAGFAVLSYVMDTSSARFKDVQAILLCFAMGLQNSFVTRLSGAVVRTTHLTGAVTDLGIEAARWFRHVRARIGERTHLRLVVGEGTVHQPNQRRTTLLLTIIGAFVLGSAVGALAVARFGQLALLAPTLVLLCSAAYAFLVERDFTLPRP